MSKYSPKRLARYARAMQKNVRTHKCDTCESCRLVARTILVQEYVALVTVWENHAW